MEAQTQTEAKHTPGPWRLADATPGMVLTQNGRAVARALEMYGAAGPAPESTAANARLITAAPDLRQSCVDLCDVLRRIQDTLSRHVDPGGDLQDPMETVNALLWIADHKDTLAKQRAALAAIAKASAQ